MSDDLRTRIAAAIMQTCHGVYMDDAANAADAVIRELKLTQQNEMISNGPVMPNGLQHMKLRHRYVTEWES